MTNELKVVRTEKRKLQKIAKFISYLSIIVAIGCGIFLVTIDAEEKVMRASIGATSFFFFMVGIVLHTIGSSDLPNLTIKK
ncbi:hypothetical protein AADZ91_05030 [Colwelliaceae bacterium 6441]